MSPKKKKNAPPVEEQTQETEDRLPSEPIAPTEPQEILSPEIPFQIPKKTLNLAKRFGVDLEPVVNWALSVEARLQVMAKKEDLEPAFRAVIDDLRKKQAAQMQSAPAAVGNPAMGNIGGLMQILPALMGSGGSDQLNELAMRALTSQINMSQAITNAVVAKITGKATSEVATELTS